MDHQQKLKRAAQLSRAGDRQQALTLVREVLQAAPDHPDAWWGLANMVTAPQDREDALKRLLSLNPEHIRAQGMLARLYAQHPTLIDRTARKTAPLPEPPPSAALAFDDDDDADHVSDTADTEPIKVVDEADIDAPTQPNLSLSAPTVQMQAVTLDDPPAPESPALPDWLDELTVTPPPTPAVPQPAQPIGAPLPDWLDQVVPETPRSMPPVKAKRPSPPPPPRQTPPPPVNGFAASAAAPSLQAPFPLPPDRSAAAPATVRARSGPSFVSLIVAIIIALGAAAVGYVAQLQINFGNEYDDFTFVGLGVWNGIMALIQVSMAGQVLMRMSGAYQNATRSLQGSLVWVVMLAAITYALDPEANDGTVFVYAIWGGADLLALVFLAAGRDNLLMGSEDGARLLSAEQTKRKNARAAEDAAKQAGLSHFKNGGKNYYILPYLRERLMFGEIASGPETPDQNDRMELLITTQRIIIERLGGGSINFGKRPFLHEYRLEVITYRPDGMNMPRDKAHFFNDPCTIAMPHAAIVDIVYDEKHRTLDLVFRDASGGTDTLSLHIFGKKAWGALHAAMQALARGQYIQTQPKLSP